MNKMISQIKDAVKILKFDKAMMQDVAKRKSATKWGVVILLVPAVLNLILSAFSFPSGFGVIFSRFLLWPVFVPVMAIVGSAFLMSYVAERFYGSKGEHMGFFRTISYSSIILWLSIIPFLLAFLGVFDAFGLFNLIWVVGMVWIFAVAYHMLLSYHNLKQQDATVVLVVGVVGFFVLRGLLGRILVGGSYRMFY